MTVPRLLVPMTIIATIILGVGSPRGLTQQSSSKAGKGQGRPSDIYPDSLTRVPMPKREDLNTEEEREAFDRVTGPDGLSSYKNKGLPPSKLRLYFPIPAEHYIEAIRWLREKAGLEPKYAELAIIVTTHEWGLPYEFSVHKPSAVKAGISLHTVDIIRSDKDPKGLPEKEEVIIRFGREMRREPKVSSRTFADAERILGRKRTLAITMIMTQYAASALLARAYDLQGSPDFR